MIEVIDIFIILFLYFKLWKTFLSRTVHYFYNYLRWNHSHSLKHHSNVCVFDKTPYIHEHFEHSSKELNEK